MKNLIFALSCLSISLFSSASLAETGNTDALKYLPVQDAGRIKPFDTFARESLQLIYGKQTYTTEKGVKRPAREVVMTWLIAPQFWENEKIVQINHRGVKTALNLDINQKMFSPVELLQNQRLPLALQELAGKRESKEKLGPFDQALARLENALAVFQAIKTGQGVRVLPQAKSDAWVSVSSLNAEARAKFTILARAFIRALPQAAQAAEPPPPAVDALEDDLPGAVKNFTDYARSQNPEAIPDLQRIQVEVHYYDFAPFFWAWTLYLMAVLAMSLSWHKAKSKWMYRVAWVFCLAAFALHTYGFGLRVYLTGRPPVSNMYESVVWVSWGAMLFSLVFEAIYKKRFTALAGSIVCVICLIVADMAPAILDESMQPLEPVLRSNYWLTIHVLTITLSYSAFFLAWGLGFLGLGFVLGGDSDSSERQKTISNSLYRALQIGTVLLAAGTILGGIWADYSWGRFWGWDPKETWALIVLLGYLAILHGRLAGWLRGFNLLASAVVAFALVLMAWYGVNYVLGAGLHTYGFGAGGIEYVGGFVVLNLIFVAYAAFVHRQRRLKPV